MRELRFRAWDKEELRMRYAPNDFGRVSLYPNSGWNLCVNCGLSIGVNATRFELMQYTGLKDKNGKEIYEGDIVTHPLCVSEPHNEDEPCRTFIGKITFEVDRGQYFAVNTQRNGYVIVMSEAYKLEVIGNIYENPELLEEVKK